MPCIDLSVAVHRLNVDLGVKPVRQRKRTMDSACNTTGAEEVTKLLQADFIREVHYLDWLSNVVLVKKANGKWQMCMDFTNLNKACPNDSFPYQEYIGWSMLPRGMNYKHSWMLIPGTTRSECVTPKRRGVVYALLSGLGADQEHICFTTEQRLFCYKLMSLGLKNARATYQRMVTKMFAPQIRRNIEVYVDDMFVKSRTAEQHEQDLYEAFKVMRSHEMKLNLTKCVFVVRLGKFLDFIVHGGLEANSEKIQAILDMRLLANLKTLRKEGKFEWADECEKAFADLKRYLASALLLAKPNLGEIQYVYLAVSENAVSSALEKEEGKK
ncbi:uncharacterized protein K02A2.6-like [Momordica charantia]|uniref:Uncharacterized protein K02A2.6-like n=1 Tax=Momordica charantia TaxID=3673 RepID=A0A6J1DWH6_MOMCH|nr:uncharacterized protein K02A2.6-like [Momordica charantia]